MEIDFLMRSGRYKDQKKYINDVKREKQWNSAIDYIRC